MLQLAVSSDDVGLVNVLDAHSFARLLPLLGEQLNEAKVEQLFEAVAQPAGEANPNPNPNPNPDPNPSW